MTSLDRDYSEKRNFIRMKVNTPAQVTVESDGITRDGVCNDLSGGGMLLTMEQTLPLDTELLITVASAHGHSPMLQAKCKIARVESGPDNQSMFGVEINEIISQ